MSFVIFGDIFSFPEGSAATNRIYTYAKGFKENGIEAHVICFANNYLEKFDGEVDDILYYHPFRQTRRNKYFLIRRWLNFRKYINTYFLLRKINKREKIIAVNSWANKLSTHLIIWILCKLIRTKLIVECNEHPLRYFQQGSIMRTSGKVKFFIESRLCSGVFCISRYLKDFYKNRGVNEKKLFLVPSTVDPSRFTGLQNLAKPLDYRYVGYFGSLTFSRDNVDLLVNAFALFNKKHPVIKLVLGGFCTPEERNSLDKLVVKNKIEKDVFIIDFLSRQEILRYVYNADALVLVRRNDLEAQASYPSKLTEFLATGKPVVTVNVGEVSDYIIDRENGFLIPPGDVESLSKALHFIFDNYEMSRKIGERGRKLTEGVFNYKFQADRMIRFINSLS